MADAKQPRRWRADLGADIAAGLMLAAIAIPEQMATAKLGGFMPEAGLFVFVAGSIAFAVFGANRCLSSGADSTITPIFAGSLGVLAAQGSPHYAALAAALALCVGLVMVAGGIARLGWVASFLSVPVTTGFLAGIAVHIVVSQLPAFLGLTAPTDAMLPRAAWLATHLGGAHLVCILLGGLVFATAVATEHFKLRIPGPLIALAATMLVVGFWGLDMKGVPVVGAAVSQWPAPEIPGISAGDVGNLAALTLVIATVVMVQTAATTRAFTALDDPQDVNRDFIGVGAGSILAGVFGLFPVNASPPRTAAVEQAGGRSQFSGLVAATIVVLLVAFGAQLLGYVPLAALSGILFAVALRIARPSTFTLTLKQTPAEFMLILATMAAIVVLPIQTGVAVGIALSLLHGIWTITRTRLMEFERVPGTSVWWPPSPALRGEKLPKVRVVSFQAPLSFLNADEFRRGMIEEIERDGISLIVFEASGVAEIDFTAAQVLKEIVERCREAGIQFAIARLTSPRAQQALTRFGIDKELGERGLFHSAEEAIDALAPKSQSA